MNILFVDDDRAWSEKCITLLLHDGHLVEYSENAEDAKIRLRQSKYDIAIIDLMLPPERSVEGLNLLRYIRDHFPDIVCFMMTTAKRVGGADIVAEAMKAGATYFFDKELETFPSKLRDSLTEVIMELNNRIFLIHGQDEVARLRMKDFLQNKLKKEVIVLADEPAQGLTIMEKLERLSEKCNFAVALMTKDDELRDGNFAARQNVVFEAGFFMAKYKRQNVVLVAEKGVRLFSDISGIIRLEYETGHFNEIFDLLRMEIEAADKARRLP